MDKKKINRVEKKYLITSTEKKKILALLENNMKKDKYYKSEIFNVYFDTDNYDLIIKSIENPNFKMKLRARAYSGYNKVFLEIKTKLKENGERISNKRRVLITHLDYDKLIKKDETVLELVKNKKVAMNDQQIASEIDYLINYFDLKPRVLIYYTRKSYVGENDLRITFDENLSFREKDLVFKPKIHDKHYFNDKKSIIMEVKATKALPFWLVEVLSKNKIYPVRFSKVGKIYGLMKERKNEF